MTSFTFPGVLLSISWSIRSVLTADMPQITASIARRSIWRRARSSGRRAFVSMSLRANKPRAPPWRARAWRGSAVPRRDSAVRQMILHLHHRHRRRDAAERVDEAAVLGVELAELVGHATG